MSRFYLVMMLMSAASASDAESCRNGGSDSTCSMDDDVNLIQTRTKVHTHKITSKQMATSTCDSCGFKANSNIGWTGKETVSFVGKDAGWQKCCDECKAKAYDDPPCAAWVFIYDGHCYQKYDTGEFPVTQSAGDGKSDAGVLPSMHCASCGFKANSNIGWTGKETVSFVGKDAGWQKCCDECKAKAFDNPPCAAWVFIYDGHCYQKYDTGEFPVTQSEGNGKSDAVFQANTNVGWTGKETVTFVGKDNWQLCREQCQAKAFDDPPCAGWVFIHDGHCYQKYDTGEFPVTLTGIGKSENSDAGLVGKSDAGVLGCSTSGFQANTNVGWTGKETVTFVGKDNWQLCREQCQAKAFDDPPCAGWVFIHDGHCYQKYDTGEFPVTLTGIGKSENSDAGLVSAC